MLHEIVPALAPYGMVAAALGVAVLTGGALVRRFGAPPTTERLVSLDGLRGYLALCVFVSHAVRWRRVAQTGSWNLLHADPPFYAHLGDSSVLLFL